MASGPAGDLAGRLRRKEAALAALREISRAISAALDLDTTLALITRKTAEVTGMDSCSLYLLDPAGEYLVLRATTGLAPEAVGQARLRWGEGLTGWAARHGTVVASSDAAQDPRFVYLPETREYDFRSLAAVPLISAGRVLGALNVQTRARHEYAVDDLDLLSTIADLAAGAIEKAALYDTMRQRISELSTLAEVSQTLTSPLYLDDMLGVIVEMATRLLPADHCAVLRWDGEAGRLVPTAAFGVEPGPEAGEILALVEEAVRAAGPVTRPDLGERAEGVRLRAVLAVPLTVRDKRLGGFVVARRRAHVWSGDEISRLSTLAHQTALAIENSSLVVQTAVVREMHHRMKNNLQTVAMLLRLQLRGDRSVSGREVLTETVNRILSIAAVHEILSVEGFRMINARELIDRVARTVAGNMARPPLRLTVEVSGDDLFLPSQPATSLALVVNELVQNALEHAFPDRTEGRIEIRLARRGEECLLEVRDDGVGFSGRPAPDGETLGLQIVRALATEDLKGRFDMRSDGGTHVTISFPGSGG